LKEISPSDPQSAGTGEAPALDPSSQITTLTVENVQSIISQAQAGATDPVTLALQIFASLDGDVSVTGDVLS
jgi:hypothetical protein